MRANDRRTCRFRRHSGSIASVCVALLLFALRAFAQSEVRVWVTSLDLQSRLTEGKRMSFENGRTNDEAIKPFAVVWQGKLLKSELGMKSIATLVWR